MYTLFNAITGFNVIVSLLQGRWKTLNTEMDLKETEPKDMDWINLVQDSDKWWVLVKTEMKLWIP